MRTCARAIDAVASLFIDVLYPAPMSNAQKLIIPAVIVGILLIVVGVVYFASTAAGLPSFFPGHQAGSSHHHTKHGIAAVVVALGLFAFAWFASGPKAARPSRA
jgi:hypothetical protein